MGYGGHGCLQRVCVVQIHIGAVLACTEVALLALAGCEDCCLSPCHLVLAAQISRRAWSGNPNARFAVDKETKANPHMRVTVAYGADPALLDALVS